MSTHREGKYVFSHSHGWNGTMSPLHQQAFPITSTQPIVFILFPIPREVPAWPATQLWTAVLCAVSHPRQCLQCFSFSHSAGFRGEWHRGVSKPLQCGRAHEHTPWRIYGNILVFIFPPLSFSSPGSNQGIAFLQPFQIQKNANLKQQNHSNQLNSKNS